MGIGKRSTAKIARNECEISSTRIVYIEKRKRTTTAIVGRK